MALFGLQHLVESEEITQTNTSNSLKGIADNYPRIIDSCLKLPYIVGQLDDVKTIEGQFQSISMITYMQAPYSFWSLYGLYQKGYYLESIIIYRHLIEAFIQLRYFKKFPSKLKEHILQTKRVNFSAMFNEFSPGFYIDVYSRQLSEAAHGLVYKDIHRVQRSSVSASRTIMGCEYNEDRATYVMNMTCALLYGYMNYFDKFFPRNTVQNTTIEYAEVVYSLDWLKRSMEGHKAANPRSLGWYQHMERFIV